MDIGALKQQVMKIYNNINQELFKTGVKRQRVDIIGRKIVILAEHQRVPALQSLDTTQRQLTRVMDMALLDLYKEELHKQIEAQLSLPVKLVLKDYDPFTEIAGTIIVLEDDAE
ncbi:Na-translocating system protein MpsC family protein [Zhaonella formicivorans]|jgi:hypothetical protein|uniref:Na-translocating system protein MpsC family protein n=1 Tax=Zhaonella formicivorans TaxID=2528593 RepID=UPI0010DB087D|nr:Na-translocating system protein MpsC family protein [Zhaonella formicivorans]